MTTNPTPPETLRKAAALMRERAAAATPGPWEAFRRGDPEGPFGVVAGGLEDRTDEVFDGGGRADADHIASWHPAVVLAVARWLEAESHEPETDIGDGITTGGPCLEALHLATTYLGESA